MHFLLYGNSYRYGNYNPLDDTFVSFVRYEDGTDTGKMLKSLKYTVGDAEETGKALCALAEKAGRDYTVTYLTDIAVSGAAAFETAVADIAADSSENDITVVYFSSHGAYFGEKVSYGTDVTDTVYIVLRNDTYPNENVLYPISKVLSRIDSIKGTKVILSDFCHSGGLVRPDYFSVTSGEYKDMDPQTLFYDYRDSITASSSLYCLSASRYFESSWEYTSAGSPRHGKFTTALLSALGWDEENQVLTDAQAEKNGMITLYGLAKYVTAHDSESRQTPMVSGGSGDIILFSF